ncbi:hypothetical protein [Deinococcus multiflagellatus]|uniref:Uncharacterized protein n=1 Tax=Deinococcus multiflagellatus TaxID=1656887 RepID=A0ABW1ZQZ1_9DEIO|nr:hypothetical protein [Deinococcus multiflagellatus]MBZ9715350.1 hypothetical protein [Deinococcus multiflagellatus]
MTDQPRPSLLDDTTLELLAADALVASSQLEKSSSKNRHAAQGILTALAGAAQDARRGALPELRTLSAPSLPPRSIHDPEPVGLNLQNISFGAASSALRITLEVPGAGGPPFHTQAQYWRDQVYLFDQSRVLLGDVKDLLRVLRAVPQDVLSDEGRALLTKFKDLDTEKTGNDPL